MLMTAMDEVMVFPSFRGHFMVKACCDPSNVATNLILQLSGQSQKRNNMSGKHHKIQPV
jgi:hypothetical protein